MEILGHIGSVQLKPNPKQKIEPSFGGKRTCEGQTQVFDLGGSDIGFISGSFAKPFCLPPLSVVYPFYS